MTATFLVTLDLPDTSEPSLLGTAEDIKDSCEVDGLTVISVKPWQREGLPQPTDNQTL